MTPRIVLTDDVFGINRSLPLNYKIRETADTVLVNSLTRGKHLVIYGSSKQGKTSLRKHCLKDEDYITIHCSNKWELETLHAAILKQAGYQVEQSTTKTVSGKQKIFAKAVARFLVGSGEGGGEAERSQGLTTETSPLELDPEDVNDIISALHSVNFTKFIVLEDFHYLPIDVQRDFSVSLKAFHEGSKLTFIIIGVWLEENRLTVFNGDLTGRVISINADKWKREELLDVVTEGERLLNITFESGFRNYILDHCFESVYILQEVFHLCCTEAGIYQTQIPSRENVSHDQPEALIKRVVNQQAGRFTSFIGQFAEGFQTTNLQMYKWILYPILTSKIETLEGGLKLKFIRRAMESKHPHGEELNPGNVTQALQFAASLQVKKNIKPIILDYDQTNNRLNVVDKAFLIWLNWQDRNEYLDLIDLPLMPEGTTTLF